MDTISSARVSPPLARPTARLSLLGDETLAKLTGKGSEQAFARLYERYHQTLYRYCRSILRDETDAQDALQSTFTAALAALQRGQRKAPLRPWLFRIAHNEAISLLRRRRQAGTDLSDAPLQLASSAEDHAAARARFTQLIGDLNELPDRGRAALLMRELSGLSHEEIAIALETSVGAAKQAIFDARRTLHELAEGRSMACEEVRRQISDGDGRALRSRRLRAHLRDCGTCSAFAAAIPARRADLRALVPPLPAAASAALLSRAMSGTSAHGANTAATGSMTTGALVKAAGTTIASKAAVGVVVAVGAAAGVGGVTVALVHGGTRPAAHAGQVLGHGSNAHAGPAAHAPGSPQTSTSYHSGRANASQLGRSSSGHSHQRASGQTGHALHHNPHGSATKGRPSGASGVGKSGPRGAGAQQKPSGQSPTAGGRHGSGKSARVPAAPSSRQAKPGLTAARRFRAGSAPAVQRSRGGRAGSRSSSKVK